MGEPDAEGKVLKRDIPCWLRSEMVALIPLGKSAKVVKLPERNLTFDSLRFMGAAFSIIRIIP